MGLSERDLVEIIKKKLEKGEYTPEQLQAIEIGSRLYEKGFNVIPVNPGGKPVLTLHGVDISKRLPEEKLAEGFIDAGFSGVAINNTSLPINPNKLLYVVRARREALDKYKALSELVNNTVSWKRGERVEALIIVDKATASKLLSKPITQGEVEVQAPNLLMVAGLGVEPVKPLDYNSPTLGIREIPESELMGLLRETGALREETPPKRVAHSELGEVEIEFKELDNATIEIIKNTLLRVYKAKPEYRNEIVCQFTHMAAYRLISPESIAKVLNVLLREAEETQAEERVVAFITCLEKAGLDVKGYSNKIEEILGVKLDNVAAKPVVGEKKLEDIFREIYGDEGLVLVAKIGEELEKAEPVKPVATKLRDLEDSDIIRAKELLKDAYKPGTRQNIWLSLSSWAANAGISPLSVAKILKALYEETGDTDPIKARASSIVYSYRKAGIDLTPYTSQLEELFGTRLQDLEVEMLEIDAKDMPGLQKVLQKVLGVHEAVERVKKLAETLQIRRSVVVASELGVPRELVLEILKAREEQKITNKVAKISSLLTTAVMESFKYVKNFTVNDVDLGLHCWDGKKYTVCEGLVEAWLENSYELLNLENYGVRYSVVKKEVMSILEDKTREQLKYEPAAIAFKNCVFDWETMECRPHSPDRYVFHYIPHRIDVDLLNKALDVELVEDFVQKATPKTLNAYKEWVGDKWTLLFELVGFVLYPRSYKKAILLTDAEGKKGDVGKSTYIRHLEDILTSDNYSAVSLQELIDPSLRFVRATIYRKLANFFPDLPKKAITQVGYFKVLTGEDYITIDRKNKEPFKWLPYTKHVFSANEPPIVENADEAFWKRWLVVEFVGNFAQPIREFNKTLWSEIPQIIALGIAAFSWVLEKGRFSYENTAEDAKIKWLTKSDPVYGFIEWLKSINALVEDKTGRIPVEDLYEVYTAFCKTHDKEAIEQREFTTQLKKHGFKIIRPRNVSTISGYRLVKPIVELKNMLKEPEEETE